MRTKSIQLVFPLSLALLSISNSSAAIRQPIPVDQFPNYLQGQFGGMSVRGSGYLCYEEQVGGSSSRLFMDFPKANLSQFRFNSLPKGLSGEYWSEASWNNGNPYVVSDRNFNVGQQNLPTKLCPSQYSGDGCVMRVAIDRNSNALFVISTDLREPLKSKEIIFQGYKSGDKVILRKTVISHALRGGDQETQTGICEYIREGASSRPDLNERRFVPRASGPAL